MKLLKNSLTALAFVIGIGASFAFTSADMLTSYSHRKLASGSGLCEAVGGTLPGGCALDNDGDPCVVEISQTNYNIFPNSSCTTPFKQEF